MVRHSSHALISAQLTGAVGLYPSLLGISHPLHPPLILFFRFIAGGAGS